MKAKPDGFADSQPVSHADVEALSDEAHDAVHVLEGCIASHHIAEVDYTDRNERRSTIRVEPAFIRRNKAGNLVLWGIATDKDSWEELRLDRIHSARDTGEEFSPTW